MFYNLILLNILQQWLLITNCVNNQKIILFNKEKKTYLIIMYIVHIHLKIYLFKKELQTNLREQVRGITLS